VCMRACFCVCVCVCVFVFVCVCLCCECVYGEVEGDQKRGYTQAKKSYGLTRNTDISTLVCCSVLQECVAVFYRTYTKYIDISTHK